MNQEGSFNAGSLGLLQSLDKPVSLSQDELVRLHATVKGD